MPEGDTVHKVAAFLHGELVDRPILRIGLHPAFGLSRKGPFASRGVTCHGKHLYLALDDDSTLRSHLGLYGAWHRYRPGEPWRKPVRQASICIETADWWFVCFNAREAEWLRSAGLRAAEQQARLGPDLIQATPDPDRWLERIRCLTEAALPVVDLLLDQRIAAGIGNVYKSEVLFLEGVSPRATRGELHPDDLTRLYHRAAALLSANLGGGRRATRPDPAGRGALWVYGRAGRPCLRCGTPVMRAELGRRPRVTFWCPNCQPDRTAPDHNTRMLPPRA